VKNKNSPGATRKGYKNKYLLFYWHWQLDCGSKKIVAVVENCELVQIASHKNTRGGHPPGGRPCWHRFLGIFYGLPMRVVEFAGRLDLSRSQYTFSVLTFGGARGSSALQQMVYILRSDLEMGLMRVSW